MKTSQTVLVVVSVLVLAALACGKGTMEELLGVATPATSKPKADTETATPIEAPTTLVAKPEEPKTFRAPATPKPILPTREEPTPLPTLAPEENSPARATAGIWEIALVDSTPLTDYGGHLPAEGHRFHQIELLVLNTAEAPVLFTEASLGSFSAAWKDYTYPALSVDSMMGYIPPGWPLSVKVVFDLPVVADPVQFSLRLSPMIRAGRESVVLDSLGSTLAYDAPVVRRLGYEFVTPDRLSLTPSSVRPLPLDPGGTTNSYVLLLDCTVANLYGQDITIEKQPLRFQPFSNGQILPVSVWGGSLDYSFRWLDSGDDSRPLAPGFTREGSFWLDTHVWPPPTGPMLLLVMYVPPFDFTYTPSEWVLYELDGSPAAMLERPIAVLDRAQIALDEGRRAASEGNWATAAVLLGEAAELHPADSMIAEALLAAQKQSGELVFSGGHVSAVSIGSGDEGAVPILALPEGHIGCSLSPNGQRVVYLDREYWYRSADRPLHVIELEGLTESVRKALDLPQQSAFIQTFAWSADGESILLVEEPNLGIDPVNLVALNLASGESTRYRPCEGVTRIWSIAWSPTRKRVVYAAGDRYVLSNLGAPECANLTERHAAQGDFGAALWSSDGNLIYLAARGRVWSVSLADSAVEVTPLTPVLGEIGVLVASPDGRHLAIAPRFGDSVHIYDTATGQLYQDRPRESLGRLIGWIP